MINWQHPIIPLQCYSNQSLVIFSCQSHFELFSVTNFCCDQTTNPNWYWQFPSVNSNWLSKIAIFTKFFIAKTLSDLYLNCLSSLQPINYSLNSLTSLHIYFIHYGLIFINRLMCWILQIHQYSIFSNVDFCHLYLIGW